MKPLTVDALAYPTRRGFLGSLGASAALAGPLFTLTPLAHAAAQVAGKPTHPPVARVQPVSETFFGQTVVDPYRWMENAKDPDWEPFMRGQDRYARQVLGAIPGRDALKARIAELSGGTAIAYGAQKAGDRLFYQVRPAGANSFMLAVRVGGQEHILLDPGSMKGDGGVHMSLDWWLASPSGRHVVYGLSAAGSEDSVLHVMDLGDTKTADGTFTAPKVLAERIAGTQYASPSWLPDGSGFFYARVANTALRGTVDYYKRSPVLLHKLGTDVAADRVVVVFGQDNKLPLSDSEFPSIACSEKSEWAVLGLFGGVRRNNPLFVARVADIAAGRAQWRPVCSVADEVTGYAFDSTHLYLLSTHGADNGKVLRTPLQDGDYASATPVVPAGALVIEGMALARDGLYVLDLDGGYHSLRKLKRSGSLTAVPLPFEGAISGLSTSSDADGCYFDGTAWLLPFTTFHFDAANNRVVSAGIAPQSTLDLSGFEALRSSAKARDGTVVPLSIVAKKGLKRNGRNPVMVSAYGAYQVTSGPYFSPRTLAFLERGGVFATAHVRGGGEYGKRWWQAGQKLNKPNTWRDLIDCCEQLVNAGWASKSTLSIQGGSAGGIAVGMALTERPDLFAGVICNVGATNTLRAEFSQNGPPNIDEFGTVKERDGFIGLKAMDALHHVKDGTPYPAVLLTVGMTDSRVEPWEGAKFAARLQKASRSGKPVLLRVDFDAGHGLGSTRSQVDAERADEFAFVLSRAGRRSVA